ncbi:MAG TPA: peptidylprolyl isomerase [Oculatellaceae cyanobacterium]
MLDLNRSLVNLCKRFAQTSILALLLVALSLGTSAAAWNPDKFNSGLPVGNAITDGKAILRYALPIDNKEVREVQANLEDIANHLRGKRWSPINSDISKASVILRDRPEKLLKSVSDDNKPAAEALIAQLNQDIAKLRDAVETKDKENIWTERAKVLDGVGQLEELMIEGFPYEVPSEYSNLPQLKGRATVEMATDKGTVTVVVDGYSAPVTAGNFVDLVQRGFYNNLEFTRSEESYVLQAGDPPGADAGFIDPKTGNYRAIPLEILVRGDSAPTYGITLEEAGRYRDQPVLPFSAYGAVAMARPEPEPNGGSSQFFFFLFDSELTPAGRNLLDGRYTVFGYLVDGKEVLKELKAGDKIQSAKVIQGIDNLVEPQAA